MGRFGTCECLSSIWREESGSLTLKSYPAMGNKRGTARSFPPSPALHPKWLGGGGAWGKDEWKLRHCSSDVFNGLSWESQGSWGPVSPVAQMLELTGQ